MCYNRRLVSRNNFVRSQSFSGGEISHNNIRDKNQQIRVSFYFTAHKFPPDRDPFTEKYKSQESEK